MTGEREREQKLLAAGVKRDSGGNNVTIHISSDNLIALFPIEFGALSGNGCASDVQTPAPNTQICSLHKRDALEQSPQSSVALVRDESTL
jgi:hypothetical protein